MRYSTAIAALAALTIAGCGSGGDGDAESTAPGDQAAGTSVAGTQTDPGTLVTAAEVGEVIGEEIVATTPGEGSCTFETEDAQASSVMIELDQTDAAGQMDVVRTAAGTLGDMGAAAADEGGAAGQDVNVMLGDSGDAPKVGDEAFFGPNSQISVRKGNTYMAVSPPMMRSRMGGNPLLSSADRKKMALEIAQKAVTRLP